MPRLLLIADDLTGACDSAVPFAARGLPTRVLPAGEEAAASADYAVLACSTDSRNDSPEIAAAKVERACRLLGAREAGIVYKKIDSILRGPFDAEIRAAMRASGRAEALVAPHYPAMERFADVGELRRRLDGAGVEIHEARTQEQLREVAGAALAKRPVPLLVGSGGLARELAAYMTGEPARSVASLPGPLLMVIGSPHPVTEEQARMVHDLVFRVELGRTTPDELRSEMEARRPRTLFLCGGDTAAWALGVLGAHSLDLEGEVVAGVPAGRMERGLTVVTKSGGFGGPGTLAEIAAKVSQAS